jgi:Bacterial Ig-like domain (group 3)
LSSEVFAGADVLKSFLQSSLLVIATASSLVAQTKGNVTFSGLKNLEFIQNYYNGGTGSFGSGPGPDYALTFTSNAQAIVSASKGGSGNFINNPGDTPVMFFQTGGNVTMSATNRVSVAILFYYSALQSGSVTVYDGSNGTGNILANIALNPNNSGCNTYKLCVWSPVGIPLSTAAGSIRFSGTADNIAIGKISLGNKLATKTFLASSAPLGSNQGQPVTFTATISCPGAVPAGTVTFRANNVLIGTPVTVVNGTASVTTTSLPAGTDLIDALFKGSASFTQSSASLQQVVNP